MTFVKQLQAEWITPESFQPYGQLILPTEEDKAFDATDAQLNLNQGIPRFYILHLPQRGTKFPQITRHCQCTQCLGALGGKDWLITVAPPSNSPYPDITQMKAFHIPGNCFIKLEMGTWHAGPYFNDDFVDFYNLELIDTNLVDHFTYNFKTQDNLEWEIII